ncbi:energy transducer TonB [Brevundimonas sp. LjRoot202]|uniref:energy transducer TonB n=1 Tax=Brevundimonas sp. LjRoot202 TaxID=3342281 RepID=UPI003ED1546A
MRRAITTLSLAALLAAPGGIAAAQERTNARWSRPVQPDVASDLYPGFAGMLGEAGRVLLICPIEADGHPGPCEVAREAPHGMGFGAAAQAMVATGEFTAARRDGEIVPTRIQTTVRFRPPDREPFGGWTGPEPTPAALALARDMFDELAAGSQLPASYRDEMMDGLDSDRRAVVGPWLDELFPRDDAREKEVTSIQMARLFGEEGLRRLRGRGAGRLADGGRGLCGLSRPHAGRRGSV